MIRGGVLVSFFGFGGLGCFTVGLYCICLAV